MKYQPLVVFLLTTVASKGTYHSLGHDYRIFTDPFDPGRLALDIGVFGVWFFVFDRSLAHIPRRRPHG